MSSLIHFLGFTPVDRGALRNSREIEDIPVQRFANWKHPLIISLIVFLWFFLIGFGDKVEKILKGSLDLIPSPSTSVKIKIKGRESLLEV